ncbi:MAG: NADH-quinone oxidoreductase subunit L [Candidatus Margulisbacteria bacterium]|nr:NADH-quinone oxidoreductase subunit L [Candidatus Margulisiibacteriota bacterium]
MMNKEALLLAAIFAPIFGALILPLLGRVSQGLRNNTALALVALSCLCSLSFIPSVMGGKNIIFSFALPLSLSLTFYADTLAVFMAVVSSFIGAIIVLYSFDYISHYDNQNEYYLMVVLFLGAMMGLVYSANLIYLFLFWEITAIACWRLIGFYRGQRDVLKADKAFLVTVFGALVMLIGFVAIFQQTGTFNLIIMRGQVLPDIIVALILFGILSKSATLPFQTWLPDAGVAPSPVTALLHAAVLVKIGVYVFARLFLMTFMISSSWHATVMMIAGASALVAAGAALVETDIKRLVAYSTISQIGFIFLGLAAGNMVGAVGGLLYILMHGLAKGGLFLCAGIIEQNAKTKDITRMGGLIRTMPVTAMAFLFCAFSVMGIPPLGGFFSKFMVISGGIKSGEIWLTLVFIVGAFMTILYLFRAFTLIFLGESKGYPSREGSKMMVACVALLAILSLAGGLLANYPIGFLKTAGYQMVGLLK